MSGIRILLAGLTAVICMCSEVVWAGETQIHLKSGYFTWNEKISGKDFVKESGMIYALGVARSDTVFSHVTLKELFEVWGGKLDYDGHDVINTVVLKSDTIYLGTREEFTAGMTLPVADNVMTGPVVGIGHKFWIRSRSSEDWNTIYGKIGAAAEYKTPFCRFFVQSGVNIPFYTRSHVSLSDAGYEDVVTSPKSEPSVYAEAGILLTSWNISIGYEEMNFGESEKVATRSRVQQQNGVAVVNSQAYQPESHSSLLALRIEYRF